MINAERQWTSDDVYCVPALVQVAISQLTSCEIGVEELARSLGVRVRKTDRNIWGLEVVENPRLAGISLADVKERLPNWLATRSLPLGFRYVSANSIPNRDLETFFQSHQKSNTVIGASVNWKRLFGLTGESLHVLQVVDFTEREVLTFDPTAETNSRSQRFRTSHFESSMLDIDGGFWIFEKNEGV